MNKLIEIAKAHKGRIKGHWETEGGELVVLNEAELRATVEQICAPLVAALDCFDRNITYENGQVIQGLYWQDVQAAREVCRNIRTLIGDKE